MYAIALLLTKRNYLLVPIALCAVAGAEVRADSPAVDYNRDVRPILSANCFPCHGFDESARQADLRLDQAESAYADRDGVRAIFPGKSSESEAWRRIVSSDPAELMPPPESHRELTPEDKALLRRWIDEGGEYARHWSFIPPTKAALPEPNDAKWSRNEIDRFVLARLEAEGLAPSAEADRRTLIRRLALSLTGLPPTADEVEAFVADDKPDAYERLVDRLLASPHFGERLALDWLDAARYADTNGYSIDGGRHIWLWRDWVINAFNRNMPYDQFLVEQLAGDLIPDATDAQRVATGFQRNNMVTHEGGTIAAENLANYNADRVKTLGEAVLGLTLGCAQCHDHKYDPITQRDYYRIFAYFNTVSDQGHGGDGGVNPGPELLAKTVLPDDEVPDLKRRIADIRRKLDQPDLAELHNWEQEQLESLAQRGNDFSVHCVPLLSISTPNTGAGFEIEHQRYVKITQAQSFLAYDVSARLPKLDRPITGLRLVFYPDPADPAGGWGFGQMPPQGGSDAAPEATSKGTFVVSAISVSADAARGDQVNLNRLMPIRSVTASSWRKNYQPENVLDTRRENGWSPQLTDAGPVRLSVTFTEPIDASATPFLALQVNFGFGQTLVAKRFEVLAITGSDTDSSLPPDVIAIVTTPTGERTAAQHARIREYFAADARPTARLRIDLANLEERVRALTEKFPTMIMDVAAQPRDTFILNRGDYSQPTEKVTPGTPEVLPLAPEGAPENRLGLARWTTDPANPLTARVAVNRTWQLLFGAGIVRTAADFGAQGEWPSHPELLDWLAVDFRDHGWDLKALVRRIVTSAAYRQSSVTSESLLERDPDNRLLARGPRFRLPAEFIRDFALKTSGLLVPQVGGPSVNPYAPGDLWREVSHYGSTPATAQTFVQDHGDKLYRRSLYTYWKRTAPPPNMAAFDAPNREICTVARPSTTTPLQALVLLNDVQFIEAARALGGRMASHDGDDRQRLEWAFEECLSRPPSAEELQVITEALARERRRYAADEAAAAAYLAIGESPRNATVPTTEHAAWAQIAALLLNLSETLSLN